TAIRLPTDLAGGWEVLAGRGVPGYEIHHGATTPDDGTQVWHDGPVLALTAHGPLEDGEVVHALIGARPAGLDAVFDLLADAVDQHLDTTVLRHLTGLT